MSRVYRMGRQVQSVASHDAARDDERPRGMNRREWAKVLRRRAVLERARSMVDLSAAQQVSAQGPASGDVDL